MNEGAPGDRAGLSVQARDVMTADPKTAGPRTIASAALAMMRQDDIRHLVVVDDRGTLQGILSNRDYRRILERTDPQGTIRGVHEITVGDIMTPLAKLATAGSEPPILEVARLMVKRKVGCVPIVDDQRRPIGILTQKDVLQALVSRFLP
jgi:CBS domain-containing protein